MFCFRPAALQEPLRTIKRWLSVIHRAEHIVLFMSDNGAETERALLSNGSTCRVTSS
jgi:hypothetical protein